MKELDSSHRAAEAAARESYGRLVSYLAWQWRDIAAAQDAMGDALLKALEIWPVSGIPDSPDAWLLSVAKRELLQVARHNKVRSDPAVSAVLAQETLVEDVPSIPDARLKLMFVCAHPAIDERIRIPLMLQTVLGLQVAEMAPALMLTPTTLAQRLVRAKQKIRDTGIRFEEPELREIPGRLAFVLESIYGAFGLSMDAVDGAESRITDLQEEALYLCDIVCHLLPEDPEALGLSALMRFIHARRNAQIDDSGKFVPLAEQDALLWDRDAIVSADQTLWKAAQQRRPGPFQLEAAIQSAHCHRLFTGITPWNGIAALYAQINSYFPTQGSLVAGAVAITEAGDLRAGLRQLEAMEQSLVKSFQPWWVAKGYLLSKGNARDRQEADKAFQIAIGLTMQSRLRAHLQLLREGLKDN
ncbi:MAG: RNA polymerase subunit sigma-70 [Curvibacter sp.]|nr:MAG: RNA polymerase subunit sigma-70 [Curvibacter sp.]